jgi:hypothetical protein
MRRVERAAWRMARAKTPLFRRILVQADCAFWCIHDHLDVLGFLGLPTLAAVVGAALALIGIWRTWDLPVGVNILIGAVVCPFLAMLIFTVFPLPCAVFAWKAARGEEQASARDCIIYCLRRSRRLLSVLVRLALIWLGSLLLFGLPLLGIWPRVCMTPLVALFEDERRIFRRSRRILGEDNTVSLIGLIYLGMGLVLGGMVFLPRLALATPTIGVHLLDEHWRTIVLDHLWIFETMSVAILLTAIAMSWWMSLTLVYHDIRLVREGEALKRRLALLRAKLAA